MIESIFTRSVCISARRKGESGPPTRGWRYRLSGTSSDDEAIRTALAAAQRAYGDRYEGFAFARSDANYAEVVDPEVRGGIRYQCMFEWKPGEWR